MPSPPDPPFGRDPGYPRPDPGPCPCSRVHRLVAGGPRCGSAWGRSVAAPEPITCDQCIGLDERIPPEPERNHGGAIGDLIGPTLSPASGSDRESAIVARRRDTGDLGGIVDYPFAPVAGVFTVDYGGKRARVRLGAGDRIAIVAGRAMVNDVDVIDDDPDRET